MNRTSAIVCLSLGLLGSHDSHAYGGETVASFDYGVSRFLMSPDRPVMYVSATSINSVVAIDTNTLQVLSTTYAGSNPTGMAISADGDLLYVANSGSNFIGVIDTHTGSLVASIASPEVVSDVEVGRDGRLYVLGTDSLMQIDPRTGASAGPNIDHQRMVYSGELAISPDKGTLYYANYGLSPASLYQFDVSTDTARLLWESPHGGTSGSNGQDLAISHDGSFVSYATGAGQIGYSIAKYRADGMLIEGSFNTGAYPREITFSPDDAVAYTVNESGAIKIWDTQTFLSQGQFSLQGEAYELAVDGSGRYLFAAVAGYDTAAGLRVIDTGRIAAVPEVSSAGLMALGLGGLVVATRRSMRRRQQA